jgi:hypothetical protein
MFDHSLRTAHLPPMSIAASTPAIVGYNTKEKLNRHVIERRKYIPSYPSLLADGNKSGQPNWAGKIAT